LQNLQVEGGATSDDATSTGEELTLLNDLMI
jgi:hypothetical protein